MVEEECLQKERNYINDVKHTLEEKEPLGSMEQGINDLLNHWHRFYLIPILRVDVFHLLGQLEQIEFVPDFLISIEQLLSFSL